LNLEDIKKLDPKTLRHGSQLLLRASGERYLNSFTELVSMLTRTEGSRGVLISTLWSANALSRRIGLGKLPRGSLKVIDTISLSLGSKATGSEGFIFLPTPSPLEYILVEIERLIKEHGKDMNFLILDTLTFLERHYTQGQLSEFFHYLLNRMLEEEITVIIFDQSPSGPSGIGDYLSSVMDRTINIGTEVKE
jgi:KaiC/GvpD/RAD55 family RecA-like ATPase